MYLNIRVARPSRITRFGHLNPDSRIERASSPAVAALGVRSRRGR
jgi:hypothetical protein